MISIRTPTEAATANYELALALLAQPRWELRVAAELLATLTNDQYELSVAWGKLIFAWWNETFSQSWRIVGYEVSPVGIQLRFATQLDGKLQTCVLRGAQQADDPHTVEMLARSLPEVRHDYADRLGALLQQRFPDAQLTRVTGAALRAESSVRFSDRASRYARWHVRAGNETWLVIGVNGAETTPNLESICTAGLIWLTAFNEAHQPEQRAARLLYCLPVATADPLLARLQLLDLAPLQARLEAWLVDERAEQLTPTTLATQRELLNWHVRDLQWPAPAPIISPWRTRICALAPTLIEVRALSTGQGERYLIHGLEFARANASGQVRFGVTKERASAAPLIGTQPLHERTFARLAALVAQIVAERRPERSESMAAPDQQAPFFRWRAEAWLESLLRRDLTTLDETLDARFVYSQIPAWQGDQRSVLDLLAVNRAGRLVILEIKASEDAQLPLQGLDYWLSVEQARQRGELTQRGLFPTIALADAPPLLYLVAPHLRFHRNVRAVARCIRPEIEVYRLGLNRDWRSGVKLHSKERLN